MKIQNVLWIVDHLGYDGVMHGAGKYYLNTIPYFDKNKFNITLCVIRRKDYLTKLFEAAAINIKHLGRGKLDPRTIFDLFRMIRIGNIHLIHCHGYGSDNFGRVLGKLLRIPTIVHAHDDNSNYPVYQKVADFFLIPFTNKAVAVSETVKESCILKRRINKNNLSVLHNGIQLEKFITLEKDLIQKEKMRLNIKPGSKVIGTVARLRKEKGIKYLIQSVPKILNLFPDTVFFIAGDGPLRGELENLAKDLGIENRIIFAGFRNDIPTVLSIIDIFVAPSLTEGSPLGILEAMAMGKPIVASNVGGIAEILKDNDTGLLVSPQNAEALAEKIIDLIKDENKSKSLSKKANEEIKKYDMNSYIKNLEDFYLELLK